MCVSVYVQVSCSCSLSGAVFSLRQVMSSVTSTSAGHLTRERNRDGERIRNNKDVVHTHWRVHEGERGRLNHVTHLLLHSTVAPLGFTLFTLLSVVCTAGKGCWGRGGVVACQWEAAGTASEGE